MPIVPLCRISAKATFPEVVRDVADAIREARRSGESKLLVVATDVQFGPPSVSDRYLMARTWAEAAGGRLTLAMACPAGLIDHEKLGVIAGRNFGMQCDVFCDEAEARDWLVAQEPPEEPPHWPLAQP